MNLNYWLLPTEEWELVPDNYDGAESMTLRGRRESLEKAYSIDFLYKEYE